MRVIAGTFRSRNLKSVEGPETRPTYDRLKETLFNVLASAGRVDGAVFADLFAGTGSVGIEALSRGARTVYFAEQNKKAARVLRENIASLKITDQAIVAERDVPEALREWDKDSVVLDVCFLDPPYKLHGAYDQVLRTLSTTKVLAPEGIVVAEHDKRFDPGEAANGFTRYRRLDQGDSSLSFYRRG